MGDDPPTRAPQMRGIGFRTALAVNLVMLAGVVGFIAFDYFRETNQRVQEKMTTLDDEAMTVHQALVPFGAPDATRAQALVNKVCARMSDETSPGHHIVAESGGQVWQSQMHRRDSDEMVRAIRSAAAKADRRAQHAGAELVTGVYQEGGVTVYVAEEVEKIHREVRAQVVWRSLAVVGFGIVLTLAVNLVIHQVVARPLRRLVRTIDAIRTGQLGAQVVPFASDELNRLAAAVNDMSRALADAAERRRLTLQKAQRVQENLLPRPGQIVPGICVASLHRPADEVAGDYFDVIALPDGSVLCCVADVVGHGVPAAMVAAILKVLLLDAADVDADPGQVIRRVNRRFATVALPEDFASLLVVLWQPGRPTLSYASAGHEPGLLLDAEGKLTALPATGPLLNLAEGDLWETGTAAVAPGTTLICLTDGLSEAMDRAGQPFGRARLAAALAGARGLLPARILAALDTAVQQHQAGTPSTDDCTVLVVQFGADR